MSADNIINIAIAVVNTIMTGIGWYVMWVIAKKTLRAANPVEKTNKKRELIGIERRALKRVRMLQVLTILLGILQPLDLIFSPLRAVLGFDIVSVVLSVVAMLSMFGVAITAQFEIRRIRSGEYLKDIMRARSHPHALR